MPDTSARQFAAEEIAACFRRMLRIRFFEEALGELFSKNLIGGTSHFCIGQEACAVGVVSEARDTDYLVSNHRGHGHLLARGLDPVRVMAELLGRKNGYCGGRGGSQHMCAMEEHFLGTNGITGGGIPIGTGAAYALKCRESDQIVIVFFGDGAANQGACHESLNMAGLWQLPALYVCENNLYGMSMPASRSTAGPGVVARAASYSIPGETCDGMDVTQIKTRAAELIDHVRSGRGPALLELMTYRFCGHSKNDARVYRTREEEAQWQERDCLKIAASWLREHGVAEADVEAMREQGRDEIDGAVSEALACPYGDERHAVGDVYA